MEEVARTLRLRAESALNSARAELKLLNEDDVKGLVHELQVHHVELEMQNDELRQVEHELEFSRAQYQRLFDLAPISYIILDEEDRVQRANLAALQLLGVEPARILGHELVEFVDPAEADAFRRHLSHIGNTSPASCEVRVQGPGGALRLVRMDCNAQAALGGACCVMFSDVSERAAAETALRNANQQLEARVAARTEELSTQNRALSAEIVARSAAEEQRARLEARLRDAERLEGLGVLAGGIAHDFNNLLVGVLSSAELGLEEPGLSENLREGLETIRDSARQAGELTRQLLLYAGHGKLSFAPLDLPVVTSACLALLRARTPEHIALVETHQAGQQWIRADTSQVRQVVTNLLNNANEAIGSQEGTIQLRTSLRELDAEALSEFPHNEGAAPGVFVVLEVEDSGGGMDAKLVARVFDPFFSTKFAGRGLGLASVRGIVQRHAGALRVRSEQGRGTVFEIAWPAATPAEGEAVTPRSEPPSNGLTTWRGAGPALVVDDEEGVRGTLQRVLKRLGFDVSSAASGAEALDLFHTADPPFVLAVVDRVMPLLSGVQVLTELRKKQPSLPVILVSGYSSDEAVAEDPHLAFLSKPVSLAVFHETVQGIMTRAAPAVT